MSHLLAVNLATGWLGVSTHAMLLRTSNRIYAAAALSQSKVHNADRPRPSVALAVVQPAVKCSQLRREGRGDRERAVP